jgi:hypothetical protein
MLVNAPCGEVLDLDNGPDEGLQVVIVGSDLTESARLVQTGRELDIKLMPQALDPRLQLPLALAGDGCLCLERRGLDARH